jgi:hypothetical protein
MLGPPGTGADFMSSRNNVSRPSAFQDQAKRCHLHGSMKSGPRLCGWSGQLGPMYRFRRSWVESSPSPRTEGRNQPAKQQVETKQTFTLPSLFRNSLPGCESNQAVKEWRFLTRESERSKGLSPGCDPNLHGCFRIPQATAAELKLASRDPNRRKPAKTGPEMQKAESIHSRPSVLTD